MNDSLFFLGVLAFFFVLWVASGGPTKPISFSGAYITPITNVDSQQTGYGPQLKVGGTISAGGGSVTVGDKTAKPAAATPVTPAATTNTASTNSSYAGEIVLSRSTTALSTDPDSKFIHIVMTSKALAPVSITHWKFVSTADSALVIISNDNASLAPGTSTTVVTSFPSSTKHDTIKLEDTSNNVISSFTY